MQNNFSPPPIFSLHLFCLLRFLPSLPLSNPPLPPSPLSPPPSPLSRPPSPPPTSCPSPTEAEKVSHLLGINSTDLVKALIKPRIRVGNEYVQQGRNLDQVGTCTCDAYTVTHAYVSGICRTGSSFSNKIHFHFPSTGQVLNWSSLQELV